MFPPPACIEREELAVTAGPPRGNHVGRSGPGSRKVPARASLLADTTPVPGDDLVRVHQDAARFFQERLAGSWVPDYLAARGFDPGTLARWQVRYAPSGWSGLLRHLRALRYGDKLIQGPGPPPRPSPATPAPLFGDPP